MQFLSISLIVSLHNDLIAQFGGSLGVRDKNLLESALAQPKLLYAIGIENDLFMLAAYYCFHLINNHPFVDGNKRIGTLAMLIFLKINGESCNLSKEKLYNLAMSVATSKIEIKDIAKILQSSSKNFS